MLKQHSWVCAQGKDKKQSWAPEVSGSANISGGQKSRLKHENSRGRQTNKQKREQERKKKKNPREKEQFEEPNLRACETV